MVHKQSPIQLEIFSSDTASVKTQEKSKSFFGFFWSYEKTILIIITFLVVSVVSFSLGVERGKRIAFLKTTPTSNVEQNIKTLPVKIKDIEIENKKPKELPTVILASSKPITITKESQENYTIQVATYKSKTYAQKEAQLLKNKGFQPRVFSKDNHIQLCVGQFLSKDEARASLKELRKQYQDCFIRRL